MADHARAESWLRAHEEEHSAAGSNADLNQYWYSANTIATLVQAVREVPRAGARLRCAFVSTPSLFFAMDPQECIDCRVLDYDRALGANYEQYVFYDFHEPTKLPAELAGAFGLVVIDPPYIEQDVWRQYSKTAKFLLAEDGFVLGTTILENATLLHELLGVRPNNYLPSIPHLPYQYATFTNYQTAALQQRNPEVDHDPQEFLNASREAALDRGPTSAEVPIRGAGASYDFEAMLEAELKRAAGGVGGQH